MPIALIVHGGAGDIPAERHESAQQGCRLAALAGWQVLLAGGSSLDAVEVAVCTLEDNPAFNAGTGACLSAEGRIELDAGIMDGRTLDVGAVAGVERIKNPIALARKVLASPHVFLIGHGAEHFAREQGIARCTFEELLTERQYHQWQSYLARHGLSPDEPDMIRREIATLAARDEPKRGTVGAVALDSSGGLAAATSTGGIHNKYPGRVGDSPLVGCGFYAYEDAAVSCTGDGEDFVRLLLARRAATAVAGGLSAGEAAQAAVGMLRARASGKGGLIVVDQHGRVGLAHNSRCLAHAYMIPGLNEPGGGIALPAEP
jgi:beta-aspartyl-peptidase (threonine type)